MARPRDGGVPMRRHRVMLVVACAAALWCAVSLTATGMAYAGVAVAGTWHRAIEVPGTSALSNGGGADLSSVSCASAGNCAVVGDYGGRQFVASEQDGTWQPAIELPGTDALDAGGFARVTSVSCAS